MRWNINKNLFRKSSIDRVNSPEQLGEYIRVANPGVWLILAAIVVLLVGVVVWSILGTIKTTVNTCASVKAIPLFAMFRQTMFQSVSV